MHDDQPKSVPREVRLDPLLAQELERLIQRGREMLISCGWNGERYAAFRPGGIEVLKFRSQSVSVVRRTFGERGGFLAELRACIEDRRAPERGYHIVEFVDVLERAFEAVHLEMVFRAAPEMLMGLDSTVEVAEALSNAGFQTDAASRAARLLEKLLVAIGESTGIEDSAAMSPDELNDRLASDQAVTEDEHRRIAACLQIARDLGGPRGACIPDGELGDMVGWIRDFTLAHRVAMSNTRRSQAGS